MKEPLLEPLLRRLRIRRILPVISKYPNCELLDVGCGWEVKLLREVSPYIKRGTGIDFKAPVLRDDNITTISQRFSESLPFAARTFDVVTLCAVLEHLEHPKRILEEIRRVLKPGGVLVGTVPSKASQPVLEFLSFRLGS